MELITCNKCIQDNIADLDFKVDSDGICNYCLDAVKQLPKYQFSQEEENLNLDKLANELKGNQKGKYDSILGLSGGVDSSYVAMLAKRMDLNPLVVHFDNGWNSEEAVSNIKNIVQKNNFDLHTLVVSWKEFKDLQRAYFKADVVDIEVLTDHAIMATLFKLAKKHNIRYILSGTNYKTEQKLPKSWTWNKLDWLNIKDIHARFGQVKLKTYPNTTTITYLRKLLSKKLIIKSPLNLINYNKTEAIESLKAEYGWKYYGGKHYESVFTKFYQSYVLPKKFMIDKRKAHYSCLIRTEEIDKNEAIMVLDSPPYNEEKILLDLEYISKKLGFAKEEFIEILNQKPIPHNFYKSDNKRVENLNKVLGFIKKMVKRDK